MSLHRYTDRLLLLSRGSNGPVTLRSTRLDVITVHPRRMPITHETLLCLLLARIVDVFEIESVDMAGKVA